MTPPGRGFEQPSRLHLSGVDSALAKKFLDLLHQGAVCDTRASVSHNDGLARAGRGETLVALVGGECIN